MQFEKTLEMTSRYIGVIENTKDKNDNGSENENLELFDNSSELLNNSFSLKKISWVIKVSKFN